MSSPWLNKSLLFKFGAGLGIFTQFMVLMVKTPADEFNRPAAIQLVSVHPKNFPHQSQPATTTELRERFELSRPVNVMAVEVLSGNLLATFHAADALFELVQPGNVFFSVTTNLAGSLTRNRALIFLTHIWN